MVKARAQIGLNNISVAIQLLKKLIEEHPKWEVPYRALTRIYENRNNIKEAEALYLKAINNGCRSKQMCKQYEWFLLHFIPPVQAIYAPGFGAQRLQQQFMAARAIAANEEPGLRFGYR